MTNLIPAPKWALFDPDFEELLAVEDAELDKLIEEVLRLRGQGINTDDHCIRMVTINAEQVGPNAVRLSRGNSGTCRLFTIEAVERHLAERKAT